MTNSDQRTRAESALAAMFDLLSEKMIRNRIDLPIENAAASSMERLQKHTIPEGFNRNIAEFVRDIHASGLPIRRILSPAEALSEALAILREITFDCGGSGYAAATLIVLERGWDGLCHILAHIVERLKLAERSKYIDWIFTTHLNVLGWEGKCAVTEVLLERFGSQWPESLARCSAAQLASECSALILMHLRAEALLEGVFSEA